MKGDKKPIAFVEDTCVDPKHLKDFAPRFADIFAKHDTTGAYYGHCSVGCLHIRPVIDLKTPRGLEQVRAIADEITSLVLEFGGTISSEHRSEEHTSELQSLAYLVCRLLLEKKKKEVETR